MSAGYNSLPWLQDLARRHHASIAKAIAEGRLVAYEENGWTYYLTPPDLVALALLGWSEEDALAAIETKPVIRVPGRDGKWRVLKVFDAKGDTLAISRAMASFAKTMRLDIDIAFVPFCVQVERFKPPRVAFSIPAPRLLWRPRPFVIASFAIAEAGAAPVHIRNPYPMPDPWPILSPAAYAQARPAHTTEAFRKEKTGEA